MINAADSSKYQNNSSVTSNNPDGVINSYSLFEVLNMSQNELNPKVFMFESKKTDLFDSNMDFTEI